MTVKEILVHIYMETYSIGYIFFYICGVNVCSVQNRISACDAAPVKCVDKYAEFSFCTVHK